MQSKPPSTVQVLPYQTGFYATQAEVLGCSLLSMAARLPHQLHSICCFICCFTIKLVIGHTVESNI
jgi:hypothetical protein